MDSRSAAVITAAIEEQKAQEAAHEAQKQSQGEVQTSKESTNNEVVSEEQHRELQQLAQQHQAQQETEQHSVQSETNQRGEQPQDEQQHQFQVMHQQLNNHLKNEVTDKKALPRKSTQRPFQVDPDLNVAVGIVQDIVGPRANHTSSSGQPEQQTQQYETGSDVTEAPLCSRCKKEFAPSLDGKTFKLCPHCRELQRQRSRRWQQKIKQKEGACKRCGANIPQTETTYVLCPPCRLNLRTRKATRYESGKCVHCSGINDSTEFKVCTRCRNNDKMRRKNLEDSGCCNRCANPLKAEDENHKVCNTCRSRKKNIAKAHQNSQHPTASSTAPNTADQNINYQQQFAQQAQQLEANLFAQ